jgi:hypothetical protein
MNLCCSAAWFAGESWMLLGLVLLRRDAQHSWTIIEVRVGRFVAALWIEW